MIKVTKVVGMVEVVDEMAMEEMIEGEVVVEEEVEEEEVDVVRTLHYLGHLLCHRVILWRHGAALGGCLWLGQVGRLVMADLMAGW